MPEPTSSDQVLGPCLECGGKVKQRTIDEKEYAKCKKCKTSVLLKKFIKKSKKKLEEEIAKAKATTSKMNGVEHNDEASLSSSNNPRTNKKTAPKNLPRLRYCDLEKLFRLMMQSSDKTSRLITPDMANEFKLPSGASYPVNVLEEQLMSYIKFKRLDRKVFADLARQCFNSLEGIKSLPDFPIKKFISPLFLFRAEYCKTHKIEFAGFSHVLNAAWNALPQAERDRYTQMANQNKKDNVDNLEKFLEDYPQFEKYRAKLVKKKKGVKTYEFASPEEYFCGQAKLKSLNSEGDVDSLEHIMKKARRKWGKMSAEDRKGWEEKYNQWRRKQTANKRAQSYKVKREHKLEIKAKEEKEAALNGVRQVDMYDPNLAPLTDGAQKIIESVCRHIHKAYKKKQQNPEAEAGKDSLDDAVADEGTETNNGTPMSSPALKRKLGYEEDYAHTPPPKSKKKQKKMTYDEFLDF